jgi:hypothetical protein
MAPEDDPTQQLQIFRAQFLHLSLFEGSFLEIEFFQRVHRVLCNDRNGNKRDQYE